MKLEAVTCVLLARNIVLDPRPIHSTAEQLPTWCEAELRLALRRAPEYASVVSLECQRCSGQWCKNFSTLRLLRLCASFFLP